MSAPEQALVDAIYRQRFPAEDQAHAQWRRDLWQVLVDDFFEKRMAGAGTVLDFGCGRGEFLNAVVASRRIGVDLQSSSAGHLEPSIEFHEPRGVAMPGVKDGEVDVVFCSNLLEHLPDRDTVTALLQEFRRVLAPGGKLLILGPNLRYTGAAYWGFFDHILPFTHHTLVEALATAGLRCEELIPRFLPYTTVGSSMTSLNLVRLYLRLPLAWRLLGAQFFCVARPQAI
jgi:SAM-dependent methyltransferase